MCRAVRCRKCNKTTWAGCGRHVDQVMAKVPKNQRCTCAANPPDADAKPGFMMRLFGGR